MRANSGETSRAHLSLHRRCWGGILARCRTCSMRNAKMPSLRARYSRGMRARRNAHRSPFLNETPSNRLSLSAHHRGWNDCGGVGNGVDSFFSHGNRPPFVR